MHTNYRAELKHLEALLQQLHFSTALLPKSDTMPIDMLSVSLDQDAQGRQQFMTFTFYPTGDELQGAKLLQLFSQFPFSVENVHRRDLETFFPFLNNRTPLGFFGLNDDGTHVIFKYVLAIPAAFEIDSTYLSDIMDLCIYVLHTHRDVLDGLSSGTVDAQKAIHNLIGP